jgi:FkbM family methyltransferase
VKKILLKNPLLYFFYKRIKIFRNSFKNSHLGEYGEDIFIRRFFKNLKSGTYVDVGCYHPIKGSLTYCLYKSGWSGINIDLSQTSIDLFKISRPKDINVRAAISNFDGETHYYESGKINQQNSLEGNNENKIKIEAYKLNTLLEKFKINKIDFLNIDAEGHDFNVISNFDFIKYKPKLISIEHNSYDFVEFLKSDIHNLLVKNKYFLTSKYGVTSLYIDSKFKDDINKLMSI